MNVREARPLGARFYRLTRTIAVLNGRAEQLKPRRPTSGSFIRRKDLDRAYVVGFFVGAMLATLVCILLWAVTL